MNELNPPKQELVPNPEKLPQAIQPPAGKKVNVMSIISLVTGVAPFVLIWIKYVRCIGTLFPIAAIVFGVIGLSQIKKSNDVETGKGMAIAGIILGAVLILVAILLLVLGFALGIAIFKNLVPGLNSLGL